MYPKKQSPGNHFLFGEKFNASDKVWMEIECGQASCVGRVMFISLISFQWTEIKKGNERKTNNNETCFEYFFFLNLADRLAVISSCSIDIKSIYSFVCFLFQFLSINLLFTIIFRQTKFAFHLISTIIVHLHSLLCLGPHYHSWLHRCAAYKWSWARQQHDNGGRRARKRNQNIRPKACHVSLMMLYENSCWAFTEE